MYREDYDEIRSTFEKFLGSWKTKDLDVLDECFVPDTKCYLSTVKDYSCGSQHSIYGIRNFVEDMAETDVFHIRICNYVSRIADNVGHQIATVICRVAKYGDNKEINSFEFSALFANGWIKTETGSWKMNEVRMDIVDYSGDFEDFSKNWYFEDKNAKWYQGVHLPVINGELDSPWNRIPHSEIVLSEEEKVMETFSRYAFGIDTISFENVSPIFSDDFVAVMAPWGNLDKRGFMSTIKYHRQPARYWTHSVVPEKIEINGDNAELRLYRMAGHKQRSHPIVITKENVDTEYACARYEVKMKKENGIWKLSRIEYFLGILEVGSYIEQDSESVLDSVSLN
ncbi:nuclear transport factor 2 family protein [Niallia circulans]|uniref:nuclear transport factor 2 family protein n=1 Tax=Niallia circulans TaxID=1397 RepID=UPI003512630E